MLRDLILWAAFFASLGSGLVAGVFFAFSTFVMRGLKDLPVADGIKAMNAINARAMTPGFMTVSFGTGLLCLFMMIAGFLRWFYSETPFIMAGGALYIVGAVIVTMVRNVPLNNALAATNIADAAAPQSWKVYLSDWTNWNHVRTVSCTIACAIMIAGVVKAAGTYYGESWLRELTLGVYFLAAVGSGLAAGVFFAFSTFVMRGLKDLPVAAGIKAMNAIDVRAMTPIFMSLLFGIGVLCLLAFVLSFWQPRSYAYTAQMGCIFLGSIFYVVGAVAVTMVRSVPLNNALAVTTPTDAASAQIWATYLRGWTNWNHVRTVGCAVACALFIAGLFAMNYVHVEIDMLPANSP